MTSAADWLAWGALLATLASLAWSANRYVALQTREAEHKRHQKFFEVMQMLGQSGGPIAAKCAAAYELQKHREYGDFLERFCREAQEQVIGSNAAILVAELRRTTEFFEDMRGRPK